MTPDEVLKIANCESTPKFYFGSQQLDEWNKKHLHRGECTDYSGWYVVIHQSHIPGHQTFRILSCWNYGQRAPRSYDVPGESAHAA